MIKQLKWKKEGKDYVVYSKNKIYDELTVMYKMEKIGKFFYLYVRPYEDKPLVLLAYNKPYGVCRAICELIHTY